MKFPWGSRYLESPWAVTAAAIYLPTQLAITGGESEGRERLKKARVTISPIWLRNQTFSSLWSPAPEDPILSPKLLRKELPHANFSSFPSPAVTPEKALEQGEVRKGQAGTGQVLLPPAEPTDQKHCLCSERLTLLHMSTQSSLYTRERSLTQSLAEACLGCPESGSNPCNEQVLTVTFATQHRARLAATWEPSGRGWDGIGLHEGPGRRGPDSGPGSLSQQAPSKPPPDVGGSERKRGAIRMTSILSSEGELLSGGASITIPSMPGAPGHSEGESASLGELGASRVARPLPIGGLPGPRGVAPSPVGTAKGRRGASLDWGSNSSGAAQAGSGPVCPWRYRPELALQEWGCRVPPGEGGASTKRQRHPSPTTSCQARLDPEPTPPHLPFPRAPQNPPLVGGVHGPTTVSKIPPQAQREALAGGG